MSSSPMDALLDTVEWEAYPEPEAPTDELYATHSGVLQIAGLEFRVFQLSNGQRVIDEASLLVFCEGLASDT